MEKILYSVQLSPHAVRSARIFTTGKHLTWILNLLCIKKQNQFPLSKIFDYSKQNHSKIVRFILQKLAVWFPSVQGKTTNAVAKKNLNEESVVRNLMLDSWNQSIFSNIKQRLQVGELCQYIRKCKFVGETVIESMLFK